MAILTARSREALKNRRKRQLRGLAIPAQAVLLIVAVLSYIPAYFMLSNSLRDGAAIGASPFGLPTKPIWQNLAYAWEASRFAYPRTAVIVIVSVFGIALTTLMAAYAFARFRFREKEFLFYIVFGLLLIPAFITLIPLYVEITNLNLIGSNLGLILPYLAGGQALGIVVLRTAIESIPEELFEAAKLDGANDLWMFRYIAVPLAAPLVLALGLLNIVSLWGDYVLPSLLMQGNLATVSVAITGFTPPSIAPSLNSYNIQLAAFTIASIPIGILVFVMMRYFVSGLSQSAIKL